MLTIAMAAEVIKTLLRLRTLLTPLTNLAPEAIIYCRDLIYGNWRLNRHPVFSRHCGNADTFSQLSRNITHEKARSGACVREDTGLPNQLSGSIRDSIVTISRSQSPLVVRMMQYCHGHHPVTQALRGLDNGKVSGGFSQPRQGFPQSRHTQDRRGTGGSPRNQPHALTDSAQRVTWQT